jgi:hypothetical protein
MRRPVTPAQVQRPGSSPARPCHQQRPHVTQQSPVGDSPAPTRRSTAPAAGQRSAGAQHHQFRRHEPDGEHPARRRRLTGHGARCRRIGRVRAAGGRADRQHRHPVADLGRGHARRGAGRIPGGQALGAGPGGGRRDVPASRRRRQASGPAADRGARQRLRDHRPRRRQRRRQGRRRGGPRRGRGGRGTGAGRALRRGGRRHRRDRLRHRRPTGRAHRQRPPDDAAGHRPRLLADRGHRRLPRRRLHGLRRYGVRARLLRPRRGARRRRRRGSGELRDLLRRRPRDHEHQELDDDARIAPFDLPDDDAQEGPA